ncbi:acyl-CoA desaturase [Herbaspirillum huttiense F1]|jgi:Fatty-acid desaturase|uniref:Acyl-CoA desaturase n=1 Tax=Herbaspirillum huttiense subsp. lycopersici TaxID=3074428 RepID=A0ABU2EMM0_9BURK|nr:MULTISPECIES: acyl-CoA desaturase [Herbaspirillum]MBP1315494.1 stearoyl-CoA desaturase (delta-9 desaturase) [Herbaspirillum sp. 1130]MCO4859790.1 fatty acid desaturase [Herbaspirillum sp. WGmk3]MDR6741326.1 stearoyl-CoA desaturase (delta-9 desaturase) [Herbaspirillum sp. 1173]MDR9849404.1 acyl-CoA desaturase [Herbaspirillum huttiense SE1]MDT0357258.1 acyl-CoA desaturase [Herbaspirillum huttiense F1]
MTLDAILDFVANGLLHASGWQIVIYTLVMTHITIVGVTLYLHRCQAHRALELHAIPSHFFRLWLWMTTGMVTKEWAAIHRKHHAKCETEEDPHSPQTRGIHKVMWQGAELYRSESKNAETMEKFGHGTPDDWIEHNIYSKYGWQGVGIMLIIDVLLFGAIGLTVWAVQMAWIPFWAAGVVNGLGHFWGYRNYDCNDAATNLFPIGIIIGGEEMHNNHHTFGTSAKFSAKWYEFDIGWMYIRILETFGLAKVKKVAPVPKFDSQKSVIDFDTLQSVIANRYDVTAKYARSLKSAWKDELDHLIEKAQLESRFLKSSRKLLQREPARLEDGQKQQLSELFAHSKALQTMHEMRIELSAIWERSHSTREQLLQQLQDWCTRAEASGVKALRDFALRLRSYA